MSDAGLTIPISVDADTVTVERLAAQMLDLAGKMDQMTAATKRSQGGVEGWTQAFKLGFAIDLVHRGMDTFVAAIEAVPDKLIAAFEGTLESSHQLEILSARLAISTGDLQRFAEMGIPVGIGQEQIARAAAMMNRSLATNSDAFKKWGIDLQAMGTMSQGARFEYVLKSIAAIESPTKQAAAATELLRDRGGRMLALIRSDFEATADSAQKAGRILSESQVEAAASLSLQYKQLGIDVDTFWRNLVVGATQSGVLLDVIASLRNWLGNLNAWLLSNSDTVRQWVDQGLLLAAHALVDLLIPGIRITVTVGATLLDWLIVAVEWFSKLGVVIAATWEVVTKPIKMAGIADAVKEAFSEIDSRSKAARDTLGKIGEGVDAGLGKVQTAIASFVAQEEKGVHVASDHHTALKQAATSLDDFGNKSDKSAKAAADAAETIRKAQQGISEGFAAIAEKAMTPIDAALSKIGRESEKKIADLRAAMTKEFAGKGLEIPPDVLAKLDEAEGGFRRLADAQREQAWKDEAVKLWGASVSDAVLKVENLNEVLAHFAEQSGGAFANVSTESLKKAATDLDALFASLRPVIYGGDEEASKRALDAYQKYEDEIRAGLASRGAHTEAQLAQWKKEDDAANEAMERRVQQQAYYDELWKHTVTDTARATAELLRALGVLPGLAAGLEAGANFADQFDKACADGVLTLAEMVSLAANLVAGFKAATDSSSGLQRALGGAAFGAQVGQSIGSLFGPMGSVIGSIAGGLIGGIAGIFHKPSWVKVGEEAGKTLGMSISEELAKSIEKTSKDLHISVDAAALLNLDKALEENHRTAHSAAEDIGKLMSGIADGSIPAKEGLAELSTMFGKVKEEAEAAGTVGDKLMVSMLKQARALGEYTPEMKQYVAEQLDAATKGIDLFIKSLSYVSSDVMPQLGADAGLIFAAQFNALVSEKGLIAAVDAMGESFNTLRDTLTQTLGADAAAQILAPFAAAFDMMGNEKLRPIIEGIDGIGQAMKGLANAGYLDINTFDAMQRSAVTLFNQAVAGGADTHAALLAIAPTIQAAISASEQFGVPLSADMQKLKELAEQNGITFKTDPMERAAKAMEVVAIALDKVFNLGLDVNKMFDDMGNAAGGAADAAGGMPGGGGGAGGGGAGGGGGGGKPPAPGGGDGQPPKGRPKTEGEGGGTQVHVNVNISENPMQTQETQQAMRAFTLKTVETEVAKRLAEAVDHGQG